jgi:hypothetical protein
MAKFPENLNGIRPLKPRLERCEFVQHTSPKTGSSGYVNVQTKGTLKLFGQSSKRPSHLIWSADRTLDAYVGDAANKREDDPRLFSLRIQVVTPYLIAECQGSPNDLKEYKWFFESMASAFLSAVTADVMKNTIFNIAAE